MNNEENFTFKQLSDLANSLELVTARMLEMTTANNQLASSQTPEMRRLFGDWLKLMSEEILRVSEQNGVVDIDAISSQIGLEASSVISFLLSLHRQGRIKISQVIFTEGTGKNEDICDCME